MNIKAMKNLKTILLAVSAAFMVSCNDFLEREPLDFGNEDTYFRTADDLKMFANDLYSALPQNKAMWGGMYTEDVVSDNQCASYAQNLFYKGEKKTVAIASSEWKFSNLRSINYFINKIDANVKSGILDGDNEDVKHYRGEALFFRAYDYFRLLRNFGDVPIITEMLPDNQAELTARSKRAPRNEVARFILSDLDEAAKLLKEVAPESGRICRDAALQLKARVALYEGTWERYHAGTCFVPGNSKWPGNKTWPDFQFKAGSAEAEVNFFLDEAINASKLVADHRSLDTNYEGMFNRTDAFGNEDEVILARYYQKGVITHSCSALLKNGGGCNVTRALVNSFVMTNGLPIYADGSGYQGDKVSYYEFQNRDPRLTGSVRPCGSLINTHLDAETGKYVNDTIYYHRPKIFSSGQEKATTGYELNKWLSADEDQRVQYECTTAVPLLRAAESYLIYMEAYYERHHQLDATCKAYWQALRKRAGVDTDFQKTIDATDLSKENDLGIYSHGQTVDKTLYNIRRERRCEFIAEGMRLDDLKRWRSLDNMVEYQPEGFNLWEEMYKMYDAGQITEDVISQRNVSTYVRPLQISSTSVAYGGYTFPKQHYLEPIPISEFLITGGGVTANSPLYQNPGWPSNADGTADYSYDCD